MKRKRGGISWFNISKLVCLQINTGASNNLTDPDEVNLGLIWYLRFTLFNFKRQCDTYVFPGDFFKEKISSLLMQYSTAPGTYKPEKGAKITDTNNDRLLTRPHKINHNFLLTVVVYARCL